MKIANIPGVGEVKFKKSNRAKRLIMKFDSNGMPLVVLPRLVPIRIGLGYAVRNKEWFINNRSNTAQLIISSGRIGKQHEIIFEVHNNNKITSKVQGGKIYIKYPATYSSQSAEVQEVANKAAIRALKVEAEAFLPKRLYALSAQYGYKYTSVSVRKMHSRWGSCSSTGTISLSIWLMQLPFELIDYVICHELAHLKEHNHQPAFCQQVLSMQPDYKNLRKDLKLRQPRLGG